MKKRLLLTMAAAFAAEDAPAQTFRYLAFGDSNTCGHQDGNTCAHPPVTVDPLDPNGYPGRLRTALSCQSGNNCQVYNYGKSGEKTGPAISRLTNVLNGQQYDVMLLMHGTNDLIFDESYSALLNNLRTMDDRAAAKGVDTLFAPVIKVHPQGPFASSAARVADLKDDVLTSIAPDRDSWTANPWQVLCPGNNCFNAHYAWPNDNGLHPDPSGYDLMAAEFLAAVQQHQTPTAPTPQAPIGATASTTASWTATANTTWYHLDWSSGEQWLQNAAVCGGGSCSWTIPGLAAGNHNVEGTRAQPTRSRRLDCQPELRTLHRRTSCHDRSRAAWQFLRRPARAVRLDRCRPARQRGHRLSVAGPTRRHHGLRPGRSRFGL